jgi:regulator of protease activity HflC (stomatin/prohibitin superfamily)
MEMGTILIVVAVLFVLVTLAKGVRVVRQQETVIVERLGRFHSVLESGLNILIPFLDQPKQILWVRNGIIVPTDNIDMREVVLDVPEQRVITKDNVSIAVDAIIYLQITDVKRAAYEIQSLPISVSQLTQTSLRNLVGDLDLDNTLTSRDNINTGLKHILDEATDKWGVKVTRVELRNVTPPADVQQAMEKQMQAERERRAQVLSAEGSKQSKVLESEGEKISRIQRSEGEKQEKINQAMGDKEGLIQRAEGNAKAIELNADAQARAIEKVKLAFGDSHVAANYLIAMEYLKKFGEMTQKNTDKVFVPYEATAALGSLGSIQELSKVLKSPGK